jgi:hypothetical protein
MDMEEIDKVEEKLKGKGWAGNPEKVKTLGNPEDIIKVRRRTHWIHFSLAVAACLVIGVVSSVITWSINNGKQNSQTGSGTTDDTMTYVKQLGSYYYPTAIGNVSDSSGVYADLYYAFNSEKSNFIAIALNKKAVDSLKLLSSSGTAIIALNRSLGSFVSKTLSVTFSAEIKTLSGSIISLPERTIDLAPFYNAVMAQ